MFFSEMSICDIFNTFKTTGLLNDITLKIIPLVIYLRMG